MSPKQFYVMLLISLALLFLVIRLIQKRMLDISYCWLWLMVGIIAPLIVIKYNLLLWFSKLIDASPITTFFLFSILILFLMCLQFSIVISMQRRQIKKLTQQIAILMEDK